MSNIQKSLGAGSGRIVNSDEDHATKSTSP